MLTDQRMSGMTLVELIYVIVIIGILASLSYSVSKSYQTMGTDSERVSDAESIARSFELTYTGNASSSGPSYPTTNQAVDTSSYNTLFKNQDKAITKAPNTTSTTSIVAATSTAQPQSPTIDQYIYQPFTPSNTLCTNTDINNCVRFRLYYRLAGTNVVKIIESIHQQ